MSVSNVAVPGVNVEEKAAVCFFQLSDVVLGLNWSKGVQKLDVVKDNPYLSTVCSTVSMLAGPLFSSYFKREKADIALTSDNVVALCQTIFSFALPLLLKKITMLSLRFSTRSMEPKLVRTINKVVNVSLETIVYIAVFLESRSVVVFWGMVCNFYIEFGASKELLKIIRVVDGIFVFSTKSFWAMSLYAIEAASYFIREVDDTPALPTLREPGGKTSERQYKKDLAELKFATDLTIKKDLPEVFGLEEECRKALITLSTEGRSSMIFSGLDGAGKTSLVYKIIQKIKSGACPPKLKKIKIIEVNMPGMQATDGFVGQLKTKLTNLLEFAKKYPECVFFMDEIHTLMGAGASMGNPHGLQEFLKGPLEKGEIRIIGATTAMDFIKRDPAIERRFEEIKFKKKSLEELKVIVREKMKDFENTYRVHITDEALNYAMCVGKSEGKMPTAAIRVVERAASTLRSDYDTAVSMASLDNETQLETEGRLKKDASLDKGLMPSGLKVRLGKKVLYEINYKLVNGKRVPVVTPGVIDSNKKEKAKVPDIYS